MRIWKEKEPAKTRLTFINDMAEGSVVRHKVTGAKAVVVMLFEQYDRCWATVSVGWSDIEEFDTTIAEIELFKQPESVDAGPARQESQETAGAFEIGRCATDPSSGERT